MLRASPSSLSSRTTTLSSCLSYTLLPFLVLIKLLSRPLQLPFLILSGVHHLSRWTTVGDTFRNYTTSIMDHNPIWYGIFPRDKDISWPSIYALLYGKEHIATFNRPFYDQDEALGWITLALVSFSTDEIKDPTWPWAIPGETESFADLKRFWMDLFFGDRMAFHWAERVLTDHQRIAQEADELGGLGGEAFAELSPPVRDQLSRIFSKRRIMDGEKLDLFLHPEHESVTIYDAAGE